MPCTVHCRKRKGLTRKKIVIDLSSPSDSSADEKKKKGKKVKKKSGLDSDVLSDDSDFMPTKMKQRKRRRETSSDSDSNDSVSVPYAYDRLKHFGTVGLGTVKQKKY